MSKTKEDIFKSRMEELINSRPDLGLAPFESETKEVLSVVHAAMEEYRQLAPVVAMRSIQSITSEEIVSFLVDRGMCASIEYWQLPMITDVHPPEPCEKQTIYFRVTQDHKTEEFRHLEYNAHISINACQTEKAGMYSCYFSEQYGTQYFGQSDLAWFISHGFHIELPVAPVQLPTEKEARKAMEDLVGIGTLSLAKPSGIAGFMACYHWFSAKLKGGKQ